MNHINRTELYIPQVNLCVNLTYDTNKVTRNTCQILGAIFYSTFVAVTFLQLAITEMK